MAWRVLVTDGLEQQGLQLLGEQAQVVESTQLQPCDALIVRSKTKVTREALRQLGTSLRVIGRAGVGVDNIDLAVAGELGITVVNAPQAATLAVAELTVGLMLALARQLPRADLAMHHGKWEKAELRGSELNGKRLGIVGMGRIGAAVAERAAAFGMHVSGHDPLLEAQVIHQRNAEPAALDQLLAEADYLCMHLPLNESTRGMIGAAELAKMKAGARLISAARGGIVDESALLDALNRGQLAGAALDVFNNEPPGDSKLLRHPNLIATPHIGAQTEEAQTRAAIDIATEVLAALRGDPLRWRVA